MQDCDKHEDVRTTYLKPKQNAHTRIGTQFQAKIPEPQQSLVKKSNGDSNSRVISKANTSSISDEEEMIEKPAKRRRIEK